MGTPSPPRLTSRGDRHLPQEVAVEGEVEGEDDPLGRKKGGENSSKVVENLGVQAPGWLRPRSKHPGPVHGGMGAGWERVPSTHSSSPVPFCPPRALGKPKHLPRLALHQEKRRSCCHPPVGRAAPHPRGEIPAGRGDPGDSPGPVGLTEACRCVLERIPWIFTWLLLAAAMSTQSPRRRASPGP